MEALGQRIKALRKERGMTQKELAEKSGISFPQMSRYEVRNVQPPANVLIKMSQALGTTVDYLILGDDSEKAKATIKDAELLLLFHQVERLDEKDQAVIKTLIDAFLTKRRIQQLAK